MSRNSPRQVDDLLLQLGTEEPSGQTLVPEGSLAYTVEDLTLYLPSRRTRVGGSLNTIPVAGGRRSIVEIVGILSGGTWVEHLASRTANVSFLLMSDPSIASSITNDLTEGWEFAATTFFDEVFLGGLYPLSNDVLPWSQQTPDGSIVSIGTTSLVPTISNRFLLQPGQVFPSAFWIPPGWRLAVIASLVTTSIVPIEYVISLPPLGVRGTT